MKTDNETKATVTTAAQSGAAGVKVRAGVNAGRLSANESQTVVKAMPKVRSGIRAGRVGYNHNQAVVKATPKKRAKRRTAARS